jgi:glycosyltransferase involved in cell wall biosynthesis
VASLRSGTEASEHACAQAKDTWRSKIRLLLAGFATSTTQAEVEGWIAEAGLSDIATITGKRADVPALISAMDLGVIASQGSETIARAAFEIMSCGVPLVGTDVGVMPDLLPPQALTPPGDDGGLAGLLEKYLKDTSLRQKLREDILERISAFSEKEFLRRTMQVYEQAMRIAGVENCRPLTSNVST